MMMTYVAYAVGGVWLTTLVVAFLSRKKARTFGAMEIVAVVLTLAFGAIWSRALFSDEDGSNGAKPEVARVGASCASVELRGPGASAWVYRDSRCAVHLLDGVVESVD
jgi:hypothetical protein